jgi:hypothetical protein
MSDKEFHNAQTGEIIRRELNADELAQATKDAATKIETDTAKQAARQAVLDKLGLTADEAAALLG